MAVRGEPKTAAEWMARLRGTDDPQVHEAYARWQEAQPENRASAEELDQIWEAVGVLGDDPLVQDILAAPPRRRFLDGLSTLMAPRLAAGALVGLALVLAILPVWRFLNTGEVYETLSGEQRIVELADGSRLHLNVATRLEVTLRDDVRDVQLVQGQAFFEIAKDPNRPFVVTAGDKEITVLGTKFDVLLQGGDTRVTVIEGKVAVTSLGSDSTEGPHTPPPQFEPEAKGPKVAKSDTPRLELTTRDAISWPRSAPPSSLAPTSAIAAVEAWRSGKVVFDRTPLEQAVHELDRYTPTRVRLASAELGALAVSGVFYVDRLADVDALIFALENSLPITVERRNDELLLLSSR